jgi:hypothetical protein
LAFRGKIWARNLAKDWIPVAAILHRQLPCLLHHKCFPRDFPDIGPIRGELFRSKLYTKGLSWHSISWHYPFKIWTNLCESFRICWGKNPPNNEDKNKYYMLCKNKLKHNLDPTFTGRRSIQSC